MIVTAHLRGFWVPRDPFKDPTGLHLPAGFVANGRPSLGCLFLAGPPPQAFRVKIAGVRTAERPMSGVRRSRALFGLGMSPASRDSWTPL